MDKIPSSGEKKGYGAKTDLSTHFRKDEGRLRSVFDEVGVGDVVIGRRLYTGEGETETTWCGIEEGRGSDGDREAIW
ncbi:DNA methylase [Corchorus capsularis]|uniref:DNA methylase n=1 Tax=Corchorus capsularis TaxID=210143 RepID=A0A1R3G046_COCAP|nr:DNA methylase [Corchorus capsularis]